VLGKVFWLGALSSTVDSERGGPDLLLHRLERKGFVRREPRSSVAEETEYAFAHALVRDVAYAQLPRIERAQYHERAAQWIETLAAERSEDRADVAAHHWLQALELTRAAGRDDAELASRARGALRDAGDRASRLGASAASRELYAQALGLTPPDDPERPHALYRYGRAAAYTGVDAEAELAEAADALGAAGEIEAAADAVFARSFFLWNAGRAAEAWPMTEEALALVAPRPPSPTTTEILGLYAIRCMLAGRMDDALEYAEKELELAGELGLKGHGAHALITIGTVKGMSGDDAGLGTIEEGLALARELNDVPVLIRGYKNLSSTLANYGQLGRAATLTNDALRTAVHFGDGFNSAWFEVELAFYAYFDGEWDVAQRRLHGFFEGLGAGRHYMEGPARVLLGRLEAERGRLEDGVRNSGLGLEFGRGAGENQQLLPALASHACVLVLAGRSRDAGALADEFLQIVDEPTLALPDVANALVALDRGGDLGRLDRSLLETPWGEAAAAFARQDYARAAVLYSDAGAHAYEAEARLRLALDLARRGAASERRAKPRQLQPSSVAPAPWGGRPSRRLLLVRRPDYRTPAPTLW